MVVKNGDESHGIESGKKTPKTSNPRKSTLRRQFQQNDALSHPEQIELHRTRPLHHTERLPQLIGRDLFRQIADAWALRKAQRTYSEAHTLLTLDLPNYINPIYNIHIYIYTI